MVLSPFPYPTLLRFLFFPRLKMNGNPKNANEGESEEKGEDLGH